MGKIVKYTFKVLSFLLAVEAGMYIGRDAFIIGFLLWLLSLVSFLMSGFIDNDEPDLS